MQTRIEAWGMLAIKLGHGLSRPDLSRLAPFLEAAFSLSFTGGFNVQIIHLCSLDRVAARIS